MFHIFENYKSLALGLCEEIINKIQSIAVDEDVLIGLSGGSSPKLLYELLDQRLMNLSKENDGINLSLIHFFQIDERWTTIDNERSNQKMIRSKFIHSLSNGAIFHPMPSMDNFDDVNIGVEDYKKLIDEKLMKNNKKSLDIGIFGIGSDGHTASLFPDATELLDQTSSFVESSYIKSQSEVRITLTKNPLKQIQHKYFIVLGKEKGLMLKKSDISNPSIYQYQYPFKFILDKNTTFYMDNLAHNAMS